MPRTAKVKNVQTETDVTEVSEPQATASIADLTQALTDAIKITQPDKRKNIFNRVKNTPWTPKDGSPKLKLKRKFYQHNIIVTDKFLTNENIALINKLKPGDYCGGWVKVKERNDKGLNLDYPIKTAAQRIKLTNELGLRSLNEILARCVDEASQLRTSHEDSA